MSEFFWLLGGGVLFGGIDWFYRFCARAKDTRRRSAARKVLAQRGFSAELYLPTIGEEDAELRASLDTFTFSGYVITNRTGAVVGKLCPRVVPGPRLRLVVRNS